MPQNKVFFSKKTIILIVLVLSAMNFLGFGNYILTYMLALTITLAYKEIYDVFSQKTFLLLGISSFFYVLFVCLGTGTMDSTTIVTAFLMPISAYLAGAIYIMNGEGNNSSLMKAVFFISAASCFFGFLTSRQKGEIDPTFSTYSAIYLVNQERNSYSIWNNVLIGGTTLAMYLLPSIMLISYGLFALKTFKRIAVIACGTLGIIASFTIASRLNIFTSGISFVICFFMAMQEKSRVNRKKILLFLAIVITVFVSCYTGNTFGVRDRIESSILVQRLSYYEGDVLRSTGRIEMYTATFKVIFQNPLGGVEEESDVSSHNMFLQYALGGGWFSLILFIVFIATLFISCLKGIKAYPDNNVKYALVSLLGGFFCLIMFESPILSNPLMYSIFIALFAMFNQHYIELAKKNKITKEISHEDNSNNAD